MTLFDLQEVRTSASHQNGSVAAFVRSSRDDDCFRFCKRRARSEESPAYVPNTEIHNLVLATGSSILDTEDIWNSVFFTTLLFELPNKHLHGAVNQVRHGNVYLVTDCL